MHDTIEVSPVSLERYCLCDFLFEMSDPASWDLQTPIAHLLYAPTLVGIGVRPSDNALIRFDEAATQRTSTETCV